MAYATINKPSDYFNTILYTGNGSTNAITGVGFQPDWVWMKDRDNANSHKLYDGVRGATKYLITSTDTEATQANGLTSFDSDGFTLGSYGGTNGSGGGSGPNFVSWNWLASNTTASNTDGSITSTVSANTTSGFSIVSYTGTGSNATVGHGLGAVPKMIIVKNRTASGWSWYTYHTSIGATKNLYLNNTDTPVTSSDRWNDTTPTSSVFYVGTNGGTNGSGNNMIAYCFAEIKGYSKFGSYTGNGNADGPFVYTGFKPAFVIIKRTDTTNNWLMYDNKRDSDNIVGNILFPNLSNAQDIQTTVNVYDFTSNGFKARSSSNATNASGGSYIYMAFAEAPLVGTNKIPATAR